MYLVKEEWQKGMTLLVVILGAELDFLLGWLLPGSGERRTQHTGVQLGFIFWWQKKSHNENIYGQQHCSIFCTVFQCPEFLTGTPYN